MSRYMMFTPGLLVKGNIWKAKKKKISILYYIRRMLYIHFQKKRFVMEYVSYDWIDLVWNIKMNKDAWVEADYAISNSTYCN